MYEIERNGTTSRSCDLENSNLLLSQKAQESEIEITKPSRAQDLETLNLLLKKKNPSGDIHVSIRQSLVIYHL